MSPRTFSRAPPPAAVFAAASFTILVWGATPVVTKIAVGDVDPLVVGMLRTVLAAAIIAPILALRRVARPRGGREAALLAVSSFAGFIAFPILFSFGQRLTSASHAALIFAVLPIFTGIIAALVERRLPEPRWWMGAAVALTGEMLLVGFRVGFDGTDASLAGDLLVIASCLAASTGYVAGGRLSGRLGTWPTTLWGITIGGLVLLPVLPFAARAVDWATVGPAGFLAVGYLALMTTILGYVAWYWALAAGGIARIGLFQFAMPIVGLALAAIVLAEAMTLPLVATAACILIGIGIAQRR